MGPWAPGAYGDRYIYQDSVSIIVSAEKKLNIFRDARPTMAARKSEIILQSTINTLLSQPPLRNAKLR